MVAVHRALYGDDDPRAGTGARRRARRHRTEGVLGEARDGRELDVAVGADARRRRVRSRRAAGVQHEPRALHELVASTSPVEETRDVPRRTGQRAAT